MALTYYDLLEKLKTLDELTLLEVLNITSEELVDVFSDKINDKFAELEQDFRQ